MKGHVTLKAIVDLSFSANLCGISEKSEIDVGKLSKPILVKGK
ncbi:MAG: hypothetical protein SFY66_02065 [Oculatellaceae cyanobacterium bins.114]|nr:hypothetical protein [Oculatellaceae cyanobacterium bins.114]